jgi:hypothetical protein
VPNLEAEIQAHERALCTYDIRSAVQMRGQMMKWKEQEQQEDDQIRQLQRQDAAFTAKLREAIKRGCESCPVGVSREPGTKRPLVADGWERSVSSITSRQVIR